MAALTQDDLRQLMTAMTEASTAMTQAMTQIMAETKRESTKGHIDHRSIGGPPEWDSSNEVGRRGTGGNSQDTLSHCQTRALTAIALSAVSQVMYLGSW